MSLWHCLAFCLTAERRMETCKDSRPILQQQGENIKLDQLKQATWHTEVTQNILVENMRDLMQSPTTVPWGSRKNGHGRGPERAQNQPQMKGHNYFREVGLQFNLHCSFRLLLPVLILIPQLEPQMFQENNTCTGIFSNPGQDPQKRGSASAASQHRDTASSSPRKGWGKAYITGS